MNEPATDGPPGAPSSPPADGASGGTRDGFLLVDGDGRIVLADSGLERFAGRTRAELVGLPAQTVLPTGLRPGRTGGLLRRSDGAMLAVNLSCEELGGVPAAMGATVRLAPDPLPAVGAVPGALVGELADGVVHDLNNLLTILHAEVSLLGVESDPIAVARV